MLKEAIGDDISHTHFRNLSVGDFVGWWSPDPLEFQFPSYSPYASMGNNPIMFIDPMGDAWQDTPANPLTPAKDGLGTEIANGVKKGLDYTGDLLGSIVNSTSKFTQNLKLSEYDLLLKNTTATNIFEYSPTINYKVNKSTTLSGDLYFGYGFQYPMAGKNSTGKMNKSLVKNKESLFGFDAGVYYSILGNKIASFQLTYGKDGFGRKRTLKHKKLIYGVIYLDEKGFVMNNDIPIGWEYIETVDNYGFFGYISAPITTVKHHVFLYTSTGISYKLYKYNKEISPNIGTDFQWGPIKGNINVE